MDKNDEQILVVERKKIMPVEHTQEFQGYIEPDKIEIKLEDIEVKRRGDMEENPKYKQLITYAIIQAQDTKNLLKYKRLAGSGESRLVAKTSVGVGGHTNPLLKEEKAEKLLEMMLDNEKLQGEMKTILDSLDVEKDSVSMEKSLDELNNQALQTAEQLDMFVADELAKFDVQGFDDLMGENCMRELFEELEIKSEVEVKLLGFINDDENEVGEVHIGVVYLISVDKEENVAVLETDTLEIEFATAEEISKDENLEAWSKLLLESEKIREYVKK